MKKAIITGAYGQDGSYIAELLNKDGYSVYGIIRKDLSQQSKENRDELLCKGVKINEIYADLNNYHDIVCAFENIKPDEIYHMAACHVSSSGDICATDQFQKNVVATSNLLEAAFRVAKDASIVTAGSCLMYDNSFSLTQDENTAYDSLSLYGIAKISENQLIKYYRLQGMRCCTAILYNHESHRRQDSFVTKKIAKKMIALSKGEIDSFTIGNLDSKKDWGLASEYAQAMVRMARATTPKDYILATGKLHTIREYIDLCAKRLGMSDYMKHINVDNSFINRTIMGELCGNASLIRQDLNWTAQGSITDVIEDIIGYEEGR